MLSLVWLLSVGDALAQTPTHPQWNLLTPCSTDNGTAAQLWSHRDRQAAYDEVHQRAAIFTCTDFGANMEVELWDGNFTWLKSSPGGPIGREDFSVAYDNARDRYVLFGGLIIHNNSTPYNPHFYYEYRSDTWEWDGMEWKLMNPGTQPQARYGQAMAYDSAHQQVVMYGGLDQWGQIYDTWGWDGTGWKKLDDGPQVDMPVMAYDNSRGRVVMTGNPKGSGTTTQETWEWTGNKWVQKATFNATPGLADKRMTYDQKRHRTILWGWYFNEDATKYLNDLWEYDGATWVAVAALNKPYVTQTGPLFYDVESGRTVAHCSSTTRWEWNGTNWSIKFVNGIPCLERHAIGFNPVSGQGLIFGGTSSGEPAGLATPYDITFLWDGNAWRQCNPAHHPAPREAAAMVYDSKRNRMILFGGIGDGLPYPYLSDTWAWNGSDWTQLQPTDNPLGGGLLSMAYDSARDRVVVLTGGVTGDHETWELDGTNWIQRQPVQSPPALYGYAMAYDAKRGKVILYGGQTYQTTLSNQTWEWDGTNWRRLTPAHNPPACQGPSMVYDEGAERIILMANKTGSEGALWSWDGSDWQPIAGDMPITTRSAAGMVYDRLQHRIMITGGEGANHKAHSDTWALEFIRTGVREWAQYQ